MIIGSITITSLDPIGNAVANDTLIPVVNMDGVPTTQKMTVANLLQAGLGANLGDASVVNIGGGTNGYVLQTDGTGNLTWTAQSGGGNGSVGGANTQVQFNDSGDFGGNSGFTFDKISGALSSPMVDTAAVYHLAGTVIENADLTHGATSALVIPENGNTTNPAQLNNFYGNVVVQAAADVDHIKTWTFDNTGNLVLPTNTSSINYANGSPYGGGANTGNILFDQSTIYSNQSNAYINLNGYDSGVLSLGTNDAKNVIIHTNETINNHQWVFDSAGGLTIPSGSNTNTNQGQIFSGNESSFINLDVQFGSDVLGGVRLGTTANKPVDIMTSNGSAYKTWRFDSTGDFIVPGNISSITTGFPFNSAITGITTGSTTVIVTLADSPFPAPVTGTVTISGVVGTTEANDTWGFEATNGNEFQLYTDSTLRTPVDGTTWTAYVSDGAAVSLGYSDLNIAGGNVSITSGLGKSWSFDKDGGISFPNQPTNNRTGYADALVFTKSNNQKSIATQPGTAGQPTVERLVIAGGDSYFDGSNWIGEGGDLYMWAGRGQDGGDIKVDAGDAYGTGYTGGTVKVRGASGSYGGFVEINSGQGSLYTGGPITLSAGYGNTTGGAINLTAGYGQYNNGGAVNITAGSSGQGLPNYGNVTINAGSGTWTFDNVGNTYFPGNLNYGGSASPAPSINGFGSASFAENLTADQIHMSNNAISTVGGTSNLILNTQYGTATDALIQLPTFADGGEELIIKNSYYGSLGIRVQTTTGNFTFTGNNLTFTDSTIQSTAWTGSVALANVTGTANIVQWTTAPVSNVSTGLPGQAAYDAGGNLFVCVAVDTWAKFTGTLSW
jgi:hypothetical protein